MRERNNFDEIDVKITKELTKEQLRNIGKKLKELRVENGLTLNDCAFYMYSNITTLEKLEKGCMCNLTLLTLTKFSSFYKISIKELFN